MTIIVLFNLNFICASKKWIRVCHLSKLANAVVFDFLIHGLNALLIKVLTSVYQSASDTKFKTTGTASERGPSTRPRSHDSQEGLKLILARPPLIKPH